MAAAARAASAYTGARTVLAALVGVAEAGEPAAEPEGEEAVETRTGEGTAEPSPPEGAAASSPAAPVA